MQCLELAIPPLPFLLTVGHAIWMPGNCHYERCFDVYDVILVKKGAMYMKEDQREYVIAGGQMLVLEPGRTHVGTQACTEETEVYWVISSMHLRLERSKQKISRGRQCCRKEETAIRSHPTRRCICPNTGMCHLISFSRCWIG
ncbi:hypothetical protein P9847_21400 [Paenibacillus chibensis]|uniref:AraC-type arabinose-binding/dimerisation domain-containing protein n=1 Tax=Paenibacillus chibensis TaxID=59846 RepID=A0ABU6PYF1_9BACL|nr:hypothetical protein [Paenibacillus chibensis]